MNSRYYSNILIWRNWKKQVWMFNFLIGSICILLHWWKKLTLEQIKVTPKKKGIVLLRIAIFLRFLLMTCRWDKRWLTYVVFYSYSWGLTYVDCSLLILYSNVVDISKVGKPQMLIFAWVQVSILILPAPFHWQADQFYNQPFLHQASSEHPFIFYHKI